MSEAVACWHSISGPNVRFPPNPAVRVVNKEQDRYGGSTVWRVVRLGRQSRKDPPSGFGREQGLIATRFQPCSLFPLATVGLWRRVRFPPKTDIRNGPGHQRWTRAENWLNVHSWTNSNVPKFACCWNIWVRNIEPRRMNDKRPCMRIMRH